MLSLKAFAKVNFGLSVLDKREDGYHNIESIFQKIDFYDEIFLKRTQRGITFNTNIPPYGEENICYKAILKFLDLYSLEGGLYVHLKKDVWQGSGLGGASSDVAELLKGLNRIFNSPLNGETLFGIAGSLSSDAPFFLNGNTAVIRGRGDEISPFDLKIPIDLVLVYPGYKIDTPWAYRSLDKERAETEGSIDSIKDYLEVGDIDRFAGCLYNDFEQVVFKRYPELAGIKEKLLKNGCIGSSLSGSGSVIYGITKDAGNLERWTRLFDGKDVKIAKCITSGVVN